jgi:LysM repeat protein
LVVIRTAPRGRTVLLGTAAVLTLVLSACFGGTDDTEGPTSDTGGGGNTVVTLAPPPVPVTSTTVAPQPPTTTRPPPTTQTPPTTLGTTPLAYTIQDGDTLYSISRQFGIDVNVLIETNNITNPDVIRAGDTLVIPPPG